MDSEYELAAMKVLSEVPVTTNLFEQLNTQLVRDEGMVLNAYQDTRGFWTIGIGRMIDIRRGGGITVEEARYLLSHDIVKAKLLVDQAFPWAKDLDEARYGALINMAFNLGVRLVQFKKALAALSVKDYNFAAAEFGNSLWAKQVGARATRLCKQLKTGVWQ